MFTFAVLYLHCCQVAVTKSTQFAFALFNLQPPTYTVISPTENRRSTTQCKFRYTSLNFSGVSRKTANSGTAAGGLSTQPISNWIGDRKVSVKQRKTELVSSMLFYSTGGTTKTCVSPWPVVATTKVHWASKKALKPS